MVHMKSVLVTAVSAKTKYYEKLIISLQIISVRNNVITAISLVQVPRGASGKVCTALDKFESLITFILLTIVLSHHLARYTPPAARIPHPQGRAGGWLRSAPVASPSVPV